MEGVEGGGGGWRIFRNRLLSFGTSESSHSVSRDEKMDLHICKINANLKCGDLCPFLYICKVREAQIKNIAEFTHFYKFLTIVY